SRGSMYETQDHLITCLDNKYIAKEEYESTWELSENSIRVLDGYIRYLNKQQRRNLTKTNEKGLME
ncbi:MAG: four helix bundle protein, partial [Desulfobacterales bacterium]